MPSGDEPSGDEPSADEPSADQPSGEQPSGDEPSAAEDEPAADTPAAEGDNADSPAADENADDEKAAEDDKDKDAEADKGLVTDQFFNTNSNFSVTFDITDGWLEITPITDQVVVTIKGNTASKPYNGEEQEVEGYEVVSISNPAYTEDDFTFTGQAVAKGTDVDTYEMGLSEDQFTNTSTIFTNVTFSVEDGSLNISPLDVTVSITGNPSTKVFNGEEQEVEGYMVTEISDPLYTMNDYTFTGQAVAKGTDVGTHPMRLSESQFLNTNNNFNPTFVVTDGYLEITPYTQEIIVTIVGNKLPAGLSDPPLVYDGQEHEVTGYTATADSNLYDVTKDFTFSGIAEAARTDVGTTEMEMSENQFRNISKNCTNVWFVVTNGYIRIERADANVTIKGNTGTKPYNGEEQSVEGYTFSSDNALYNAEDYFTYSGTAEAKGTDAGVYPMNLDADKFTNNNDNFNVTFSVETDGSLEITPYTLTRAEGENAGSYNITVSAEREKGNYLVTTVDGTFTIAPKSIADPDNPGVFAFGFEATGPVDTVYNGSKQEQPVTVKNTRNGEAVTATITYSGDTTNVGTVTVAITGTGNYTGTVVKTYRITPAPLTITANDASKAYGAADPVLTATVSGLVDSFAPVYSVTRAAGEAAGTYVISVNTEELQGNYQVTTQNATFTITGGPGPGPVPPGPVPPGPTPTPTPDPNPAPTPAPTPTPTEAIADNPTPQAEAIGDDETPLTILGVWSLFDVLATAGTTILSIVLLAGALGKSRREEEEEAQEGVQMNAVEETAEGEEPDGEIRRRRILRIASIVPAAGAIVAMLLTQDFSNPMAIFDQWSVLFGCIAGVQVIDAILSRKKTDDSQDDGTGAPNVPAPAAA